MTDCGRNIETRVNTNDKVAFLENEVHRLTELVRAYAEEAAMRGMDRQQSSARMARRGASLITPEEALFARDMAFSAFDGLVEKSA